jgi:hypothetical protein
MRHPALLITAVVLIAGGGSPPTGARPGQNPSPSEVLARTAEKGKETSQALRAFTITLRLRSKPSQAETITGYYRLHKLLRFRWNQPREGPREHIDLSTGVYIGTNAANNLTGSPVHHHRDTNHELITSAASA